jgi:hypothetical protein
MFVWELVSCRLRAEGWNVWHTTDHDSCGPIYRVHLDRLGTECAVSGPTLTEAYAAAARRARQDSGSVHSTGAPVFPRIAATRLVEV